MPMKANTIEIRRINRQNVFQYLYQHPHITKQELAQGCELSMPTVSLNLTELTALGLLESSGVRDSTGGRKARLLSVNPSCRFAVGANITAHHISCVLLNLCGQMIEHQRIRIHFSHSDEYMQTLSGLIWNMIAQHQVEKGSLLGVGLSMPAIISLDGQSLSYASVLNFTNGTLEDFSGPIGLPCRFLNDASAGGYAELWHNPAFRSSNSNQPVVYLSLNNSIGGAFFLNGEEYAGNNQRSSEFGHMTLHPGGTTCYCGKQGCVDAYLSAMLLSDPYEGNLSAFFEELREHSPQALALWNPYIEDLCHTINNLRMAYDCMVILGGYVGEYLAPHLDLLHRRVAALNTFEADGNYLYIATDKLENSAVGAALSWINEYIHML